MRYYSTRDKSLHMTASEAIVRGLSRDGGLFIPETIPQIDAGFLSRLCGLDYAGRAAAVMGLYLEEYSAAELEGFARAAYSAERFPGGAAPLHGLDDRTAFLELWHGPTCAFKDMALQMLPHLLSASLKKTGEQKEVCILTATSGDTGKAALEGFRDVAGTRVLVFYPSDGVSDVQKLQMQTQEGGNVGVCAVYGNFDDAQSGVKAIFSDETLREQLAAHGCFFSSANSINWGRLLPQIVYYFSAYCDAVGAGLIGLGETLHFCVPTGNFGNILAGWLASRMGLPVGRLLCASNSNNVLTEFLATGVYDARRPFHTTMSPSMDILISSNLERLLALLTGDDAAVRGYMAALGEDGRYAVPASVLAQLQADFVGGWCGEQATASAIAALWEKGYLMDTHTAVAYSVLQDYRARSGDKTPCVVVSTASPYKFGDSVLRAIGVEATGSGTALLQRLSDETGTEIPAPLRGLEARPVRFRQVVEKEAMSGAVLELLHLS